MIDDAHMDRVDLGKEIDLSSVREGERMPCGLCRGESTLCGMIGECWRWLE